MSKKDKLSTAHKIDRKWVKEENRIFTDFPGILETGFLGEEETWMELVQFYAEDLKWLLSLEHHKFWSQMIYSEKAHELLVTFLKDSPPIYLKNDLLIREDVRNLYKEVEHLVFLVFLRLSTEKESERCYMKDIGEIIYKNYLFTVPIILDICLIYGTSNYDLVKKMVNDIITLAPYFLDDFQEVIPYFLHVLKIGKDKFSLKDLSKLKNDSDLKFSEVHDMVLFLYDSVATIQMFVEIYPAVWGFSCKGELVTELVSFYSNTLPQIEKHYSKKDHPEKYGPPKYDFIKNIRIDILKIVKNIFDFISNDRNEILEKSEMIDEYLTLMLVLLSEPIFFSDYNLMYSVEFEIESVVRNCQTVDQVKLNHVLGEVAQLTSHDVNNSQENSMPGEPSDIVKLKSLVSQVKSIFPHLTDDFIKQCLNYYNNNAERVIAAVLENSVPPSIVGIENKTHKSQGVMELKGKNNKKCENFSDILNDRDEIHKMKDWYAHLAFVADETYDDEYDDTYDESINISLREGEEAGRRVFVVPRVLKIQKEIKETESDKDGDGYEDEDEDIEGNEEEDVTESSEVEERESNDHFLENPATLRLRSEQRNSERGGRRDVMGRGRGRGQSKQVTRSREFKEAHKSFIGNHSRKREASRKLARGLIPS